MEADIGALELSLPRWPGLSTITEPGAPIDVDEAERDGIECYPVSNSEG